MRSFEIFGRYRQCTFGPDAMKATGEAYDAAWLEIADNYRNVAVERESARVKLAKPRY